jgi:hypothetical protein
MLFARSLTKIRDTVPKDFLEWHATCHHGNEKLTELGNEFFALAKNDDWRHTRKPNLLYVWGHSYEFDMDMTTNNWDLIEKFCEQMGNHD